MIRLTTFGGARLHVGERQFGPDAERVFAIAVYLVHHRGRRVARQVLLDLFWPATPDERRRHNLRQVLYKLRGAGAPIDSDATHVELPEAGVSADYDAYFGARVAETDRQLLAAPAGEFLAGYAPAFSAGFAHWLEDRRAEVHAQVRRALIAALQASRQRGHWSEVEQFARRVLALDPLNEEATLALAEATAMSGSKVAAIQMIDRYVQELGPGMSEIRVPAAILRKRIGAGIQPMRMDERRSPPIGRDAQLQMLRDRLRQAYGGTGSTVLLWGDPGIGKTRLAEYSLTEAELAGALTVTARGRSSHPLALLHAIVPRLMSLPGAAGASPESLALLRRFASRSMADASSPPERANTLASLAQAVFDVMEAVCEESVLVLHLDDVHDFDPASQQFLAMLVRWARTARALLIATARARDSVDPHSIEAVVAIYLPPLDPSSARAMVARVAALAQYEINEESADWCTRNGAGNPYHLTELLKHVMTGGDRAALPPSLDALLQSLIDALSHRARRVLQTALALGPLATAERITRVLDLPASSLLDAVDELLLHNVAEFTEGVLLLRHPLLAEQVLSRVSGNSNHLLHATIASILGHELETTPSTLTLWECVFHHRAAHNYDGALEVLREGCQQMLSSGLAVEVARLLDEAIAVEPRIAHDHSLHELRFEALARAGRWSDIRPLLPSYSDGHDRTEEIKQELGFHDANIRLADILQGALRCLNSAEAPTEHRLRAAARGIIYADNLPDATAARFIVDVVRSLSTPPVPFQQFLRLQVELVFESTYGSLDSARKIIPELLACARSVGDPLTLVTALRHASYPLRRLGDFEGATSLLKESIALAEKYQNFAAIGSALDVLIGIALDRARLEDGWKHYRDFLELHPLIQEEMRLVSIKRARYKLALLENDGESIPRELQLGAEGRSLRVDFEAWVIHAAAQVLHGTPLSEQALQRLVSAHCACRQYGGQDVNTHLLLQVLRATGDRSCEARLLREYLDLRVERFPFAYSQSEGTKPRRAV